MSEPRLHPTSTTHEAAQWHALQRQGGLSAAQQARFMDWLVASPDHLREYLAIGRIAGELGDAMRGMPIDLDALIDGEPTQSAPDNVVALPVRHSPPPAKAKPPRRTRLPRVAAAAALLLGLGIGTHALWPQSG
ncbi:MAG TPA: FecR/PupR family sigma factor regulator, partial [Pseudoxanthomonas sp.]|nr:FecR/PupR family sigma factor regulator [Pseudoxanthomonas sp.]